MPRRHVEHESHGPADWRETTLRSRRSYENPGTFNYGMDSVASSWRITSAYNPDPPWIPSSPDGRIGGNFCHHWSLVRFKPRWWEVLLKRVFHVRVVYQESS